jgi:hypothetical protein
LAFSQRAVRVTGGVTELRSTNDVKSSGAGWLGGLQIQPREGWPYLGLEFGNLPMPNASRDLGIVRLATTSIVAVPRRGERALSVQLLLSGGAQWSHFPAQDELPLDAYPDPGSSRVWDAERLTGWSPYASAGVGLEFGVSASMRLSLYGAVSGAFDDGSGHFYPALGVAMEGVVPEW